MSYLKNSNSTQSLSNSLSSRPKIFSPFVPTIESSSFFPPDNYIIEKNKKSRDENDYHDKPNRSLHEADRNSSKVSKIDRKPIIDMTIDIGDDDNRKILIFEGEQALHIARKFCEENSLNQNCAGLIANEIQHQIDNYYGKKEKEVQKDDNSKNIKKNNTKKLTPSFSSKSFKEGPLSSETESENSNTFKKVRRSVGNQSNRSLSNNLKTPSHTSHHPKDLDINTNIDRKENFISKNKNKLIQTPKNSSKVGLKKMPAEKKEETYTFQPKINKNKKPPLETQEKTYNRLYNLHKGKSNKRSNAEEEWVNGNYSFKPETNCLEDRNEGNMSKRNIIERQIEKMHLTALKTEKIKKEKEEFFKNYDPKTGQKLFEPRFSKDKYYYKVLEKEKRSEQIKIIEPPPEFELNSIPPSDLKTLSKLFKQLDSKNLGVLSNKNMEIDGLGNELLETLGEVFTEKIKNKNSIKFEEFCLAIKRSGKLELVSQIFSKGGRMSCLQEEKDKDRKSGILNEKEREVKGVGRKVGSAKQREGGGREGSGKKREGVGREEGIGKKREGVGREEGIGKKRDGEGGGREEGSVKKREVGREVGSAVPMRRDENGEKTTVYEKIEGHLNELEKFQEKQTRSKTPKITSKYKEMIEKSFK